MFFLSLLSYGVRVFACMTFLRNLIVFFYVRAHFFILNKIALLFCLFIAPLKQVTYQSVYDQSKQKRDLSPLIVI